MKPITAAARETPVVPRRPKRFLWPGLWAAAAAAGLAAVTVGLSVSARYETRLATLARESEALRANIARERQLIAMLRDPTTKVVVLSGRDPAPGARARMFWNAQGGGLLVVAGLPATPVGKTYQLWVIFAKNPPMSAGVFTVDATGAGSLHVLPRPGIGRVDMFAVTLEPTGGLPAPSGQMYLVGRS